MEPIPDTSFYFYLGYFVLLGGMLLYLGSLWYRWRQLQRAREDLTMLERLDDEL